MNFRFAWLAAGVVLVAGALPGCGGNGAGSPPASSGAALAGPVSSEWGPIAAPILVIGVDGMEWDLAVELLAAGRMPHLAGLMERGAYGYLETLEPTFSPIIWTTIATGRSKEEHGIVDFIQTDADGGQRLLTNSDRKVKALWNIASDFGRRVCTVGWWVTYPVEAINGVMVAQTNTLDDDRKMWKGELVRGKPGQVYPPERQNEVMDLLSEVDAQMNQITRAIFGRFPHPFTQRDRVIWKRTRWALRADATYYRIAGELVKERPAFDLMMFYIGGTDVVGHRFWDFMKPELYEHKPTAEQIENLGDVVPDYYEYTDKIIGELVAGMPPETTVIVLSDHGMKPFHDEGRRFSAHHYDAPPGMLVAAGPYIRKQSEKAPGALTVADIPKLGDVLDITPTVLTLMRIPLGLDMGGHVLAEMITTTFDAARQPAAIATHDSEEFRNSRPQPPLDDESERLNQLKTLGYVGGDEESDDADGEGLDEYDAEYDYRPAHTPPASQPAGSGSDPP